MKNITALLWFTFAFLLVFFSSSMCEGAFTLTVEKKSRSLSLPNGGRVEIWITTADKSINCMNSCSGTFVEGTHFKVTVKPLDGWAFADWDGKWGVTSEGSFGWELVEGDIYGDLRFTVGLAPPKHAYSLNVNIVGNGQVVGDTQGGGYYASAIDCRGNCSEQFPSNFSVKLKTYPDAGRQFAGWSGACSGAGECIINPSELTTTNQYVEANFIASVVASTADIKANGSDGPITLGTSEKLSVSISLTAGSNLGVDCDWWVVADTPFGWYYFDVGTMNWLYAGVSYTDLSPTYQWPLFDLSASEVLNMTGLPDGTYTFYFVVDTNMNGSLDMGSIYYDSVVVNITP